MIFRIIILLLLPLFSVAQDSTQKEKVSFVFTLGFGPGSGIPPGYYDVDDNAFSGTLQVGIRSNKSIYTLAIRSLEKMLVFGESSSGAMESVDLTYGRLLQTKEFFINANTGLGFVTQFSKILIDDGSFFGNYETIKQRMIGFPVSVKTFWAPASYVALGTEFFINLNRLHTFYGLNFCVQFQTMPTKSKSRKALL